MSGETSGQVLDGRYKLLEKLGEGGMGSVFKVEHVRMGKILALKVLRPDSQKDKTLKDRFLQEARVVARLSHRNTVQVFDAGQLPDGSLFIAMEFLEGKDLAWHLQHEGAFSEERTIRIAKQLLGSLAEAHSKGIIHRDLKPANVLLAKTSDNRDVVKLLDFGIAKLTEGKGAANITAITEFVGTPAYIAPEQARGESLDARSDIYSLGAMLFELVTGQPVFSAGSPMAIVTQHLTAPVPSIDSVAPGRATRGFEQLLRKMLEKDREHRFPSAAAAMQAFEALTQKTPVTSLPHLEPIILDKRVARREDFDAFERDLKRRQAWPRRLLLAVFVLGAITAAAVTFKPKPAPTHEIEPNDGPLMATAIMVGNDVRATIDATGKEKDRDMFVVQTTPGWYRLTLSGIPELNLFLEASVLDGDRLTRLAFVDDMGPGGAERLDAIYVPGGALYLRVEEAPFYDEPDRAPKGRGSTPYVLRIDTVEAPSGRALEKEPNDSVERATPVDDRTPVRAFVGALVPYPDHAGFVRPEVPTSSPDFFALPAGKGRAFAVIVPPPAGKLLAQDGTPYAAWFARTKDKPTEIAKKAQPDEKPLVVDGAPRLVPLTSGEHGYVLRVQGGDNSVPGAAYDVAFITPDPGGLTAALALARALTEDERPNQREAMLKMLNETFKSHPQVSDLRALISEGSGH